MNMPTADERPPKPARSRTWLWASLTALVFFGAGFATIAWANDRSVDHTSPVAVVTTSGESKSPTGTSGTSGSANSSTPSKSKSTSPTTTLPPVGELNAVAVVGDSLSVQSTKDQQSALKLAGWQSIVIDAESLRRIPKDSTTQPPYSGVAAVRDIRAHGADPHTWIVELGTNDIGHTGTNSLSIIKDINTMLDEIGPGHRIVWINIYQGQQPERTATWNQVLGEVVAGRADLVLGDWAAVAKTSGYLVEDHVHLTAKGAKAFADIIAAATGAADSH
jgi:hypothetical protein